MIVECDRDYKKQYENKGFKSKRREKIVQLWKKKDI